MKQNGEMPMSPPPAPEVRQWTSRVTETFLVEVRLTRRRRCRCCCRGDDSKALIARVDRKLQKNPLADKWKGMMAVVVMKGVRW